MSRLQIFPPIATIYPNDRQTFTAQAAPPPAMWENVTSSGDIKSDFSLEVDPLGSTTDANVAQKLYSGIGVVEITIDDQCRPTVSGDLRMQGNIVDIASFVYKYTLIIHPTTVEVIDETATQIFTESYTTVSGDVYRLELIGGFRFYRNGVLKHSRVNLGTNVVYPMTFRASISETTATAPTRIPPPRLIGDWRLAPVVEWVAPSHGAISYTGLAISTDYYGGTTPGTYTLTARVEAAADAGAVQQATATIIIPPLQVLGSTSITLQPSAKNRFKVNYPDALIAWSVVSGGGSFSQGEYTAASTPGTSIVRATAAVNGQVADITITVPAVITNVSGFIAAKASEQIDFDTNIVTSTMPVFINGGSAPAGTGNISPSIPLGVQENDLLLLFVETANEVVSAPSGWTAVANSPQGTGTAGVAGSVRLSVFWRLWVSGLAAPTIIDPGDHAIAYIWAVRGCPTSGNPWDVTAGDTAASSTSVSIPGATTTVNDCLVVLAIANAVDSDTPQVSGYTNAGLSSLTEKTDFNSSQGVGGGIAVATGGRATAGAYGATTATLANASAQGRMSIALKPTTLVWAASIGSINSSSGLWTAPSQTGQTAKITVTNGFFTVTLYVPVLDAFPFTDFTLPLAWDRNLASLISMSEDRSSRSAREKAPPFDSYPITLEHRSLADCVAIDAFFDSKGLGKPFILEDKVRGIRKVGCFDSPIRHEARDECDIDLAFQFLEIRL